MAKPVFALMLVCSMLFAGAPAAASLVRLFDPSSMEGVDTPFVQAMNSAYQALAARDLRKADELIREATALAPKAIDPLLLRAEWARLSKRPADAEAALRHALQLAPGNAAVLAAWGKLAYAKKDFKTAEDYLQHAIRANPQNARLRVDLGDFYLNGARQPERALASYRKAAELDPRSPNALAGQGSALLAQGDRSGALAAFNRAAELDPQTPLAYLAMARIQGAEGRYADAIKRYDRVLSLQPGLAGVLVEKADTQVLAHRPADAIATYKSAISADPKLAGAHAKLGMAYQQTGKATEAYRAYEDAVRVDPNLAVGWNNLAALAAERGERLVEAQDWAQRALALAPGNPVYVDTLAWVQLQRKDVRAAAATLDAGLTREPDDAQLHYRRAQVFEASGDAPGAVATYRRALLLDPKPPGAAERVRTLTAG
jgi:tetratricopeptide (TPR) repeat protein